MPDRKISSLGEMTSHLAGDRIECLICHRWYRAVCHHARLAHGVSARDYKIRFGLPLGRAVAIQEARDAWSASVRRTRDAGKISHGEPPTPNVAFRHKPAFSHDSRKIDPQTALFFIFRLRLGDTLTEACARAGVPGWTWLHEQMRRDADLASRIDEAIEGLPFSQQARMKKLGARFDDALRQLAELTNAAAASRLCVSEEAVRRRRKRLGLR